MLIYCGGDDVTYAGAAEPNRDTGWTSFVRLSPCPLDRGGALKPGQAEPDHWSGSNALVSVRAAVLLAGVVFVACLIGIHSRPSGFLASIWPANAVMLGLLLRLPGASSRFGWAGGAAAYMAADLVSGSGLAKALLLNGANLVGIAVAYAVLFRQPADLVRLRQPLSMLYLICAAALAAMAAGIVGAVANPLIFGRPPLEGWAFWFSAEFVNYIAILPLLLSAPSPRAVVAASRAGLHVPGPTQMLPAVAVVASCLVSIAIGGPGAIAFPVPALLWCGLVYPVFLTAVITVCFGIWALLVMAAGFVPNPADAQDAMSLVSVRLGVSLVALAPIMLASVMASRNAILAQLRHMAAHDPLTDAEARGFFRDGVEARLRSRGGVPFALLVIDLDHFKLVNDSYGHAAGDAVLVAFVQRVKANLRGRDRVGRLGGEEFAVLIDECLPGHAADVARRLLAAVREPIALPNGRQITVTVSGGLVVADNAVSGDVDALFATADALLYRAKENGRDRVEADIGRPDTVEMLIG